MLLVAIAGCAAGQPRSTRLTNDDFADLASTIAAQLRSSDAIAQRTPTDAPWIITMDRVENLSGDFLSTSEQWWLMEKVRSSVPMRALSESHAIRLVIPMERLKALRDRAPELEEAGVARVPTHRMGATIRSIGRTGDGGRTDWYAAEFELVDLRDGEIKWSGRGEIKRVAFGRVWD